MGRPLSGRVIERDGARGRVWALRFRAYGQRRYVTLGSAKTGWTAQRAEEELANVLADVRRGIWRPPADVAAAPEEPKEQPTFHEFSSEWLASRQAEGLSPKTVVDLRWSLVNHLLPFFASYRLTEINPQAVDRYKTSKVQERAEIDAAREKALSRNERFSGKGLSNTSINHTLRHLAQVLETAVEYGLVESNAATGKRRRLKATKPARPWVEPEQLMALLDSTSGLGKALLSTLAGGGLRIGEALALRWQHVDLGTGTLHAFQHSGIRSLEFT